MAAQRIQPSWSSWEGVLNSALTGDPIVILGDFNTHVDIDSDTWRGVIGRNNLPDMNPSVVLVLDCCVHQSFSMTNIMLINKGVHYCT